MSLNELGKKDSRGKSLSEAFVNSFGSYPIGYVVGILVFPISMGWLEENLLIANVFVTLVFASVSFVKVYSLRRIFARLGCDDNFIRLGVRLYHKSLQTIKKGADDN